MEYKSLEGKKCPYCKGRLGKTQEKQVLKCDRCNTRLLNPTIMQK